MEKVKQWLQSIDMGQYFHLFEENEVYFNDLTDLTNDDLKEIGITSLPNRKRIIAQLNQLKGSKNPLQPMININHLPYPAAIRFMRLNEAITSNLSVWDIVSYYKDSVEALIKTFCVYGLSQYLSSKQRCIETDSALLKLLARPSTGVWVNMLQKLLVLEKQEAEPLIGLYQLFYSQKKGKDCQTGAMDYLQRFVRFRNELHHAARLSDDEYLKELLEHLPILQCILNESLFLGNFPIVKGLPEGKALLLSGIKPEPTTLNFPDNLVNKLFFINDSSECVEVEPFFIFLKLEEGHDETLFLYDSQKSYGARKELKLLYMIDYDQGKRFARYEPAEILESKFGEKLLQNVFNAFKATILSMGTHVKNFSAILDQHSQIMGRGFIKSHIDHFKNNFDSGYFVLTGEPGIGKTAIMANLINPTEKQAHYFFKAGSNYDNPDDCISCLFHFLAAKHNITPPQQQSSPEQKRLELEDLLTHISHNLTPGYNETIILDAIDEAAKTNDGKTIGEIMPARLPKGIFVLISTRPGNHDIERLKTKDQVFEYVLDPESDENRQDAYLFIHSLLGNKVETHEKNEIADKAKWNFLIIKLISEAIIRDNYVTSNLDSYFSSGKNLQAWYHNYYQRILNQFEDTPDKLEKIQTILGAMAAAANPVSKSQLCEVLDMAESWFDWAMHYIGQYFDIVNISEKGVNKDGDSNELFYKFFHTSFYHFVSGKVFSSLKKFHGLWADYYSTWKEKSGFEREFALQSLPRHLLLSDRQQQLLSVITDPEFILESVNLGKHFELATYWKNFDRELLDHQFSNNMVSSNLTLETTSRCLIAAGEIFQHLGHYPKAILYFEKALLIASEQQNTNVMAEARFALGWCYRHIDQFQDAINQLQKAADLFTQTENISGVARSHSIMGINQWQLHRDMEALDSLTQAIDLFKTTDNHRAMAEAHNHMGIIYRGLGQFDQALFHLQKTKELLERINDIKGLGKAFNSLGTATWWSGKPKAALEFYQKANDINHKLGQNYIMGLTYNNLGYVYLELQEIQKAKEAFITAQKIRQQINVRSFELMDISGLALASFYDGELDQALSLSSEAINGLKDYRTVEDLQRAYYNHFVILNVIPEKKEEALWSLTRAKEMVMTRYNQINDTSLKYNFLNLIKLNRDIIEAYTKAFEVN